MEKGKYEKKGGAGRAIDIALLYSLKKNEKGEIEAQEGYRELEAIKAEYSPKAVRKLFHDMMRNHIENSDKEDFIAYKKAMKE